MTTKDYPTTTCPYCLGSGDSLIKGDSCFTCGGLGFCPIRQENETWQEAWNRVKEGE